MSLFLLPTVAVDYEQCWRNERGHTPRTNMIQKHVSISLLEHTLFFKILLLTFKALRGLTPMYITVLLDRYIPLLPGTTIFI